MGLEGWATPSRSRVLRTRRGSPRAQLCSAGCRQAPHARALGPGLSSAPWYRHISRCRAPGLRLGVGEYNKEAARLGGAWEVGSLPMHSFHQAVDLSPPQAWVDPPGRTARAPSSLEHKDIALFGVLGVGKVFEPATQKVDELLTLCVPTGPLRLDVGSLGLVTPSETVLTCAEMPTPRATCSLLVRQTRGLSDPNREHRREKKMRVSSTLC